MTVTIPSGSFRMADARDPATAVQLARKVIQSGVWRNAPREGDDLAKAEYSLRLHAPAALAVLPRVAIHAATKVPPPGGCSWCSVFTLVLLSFGEETEPARDELTLAFLGRPCRSCQRRHAEDAAIVAAVREETARQAKINAKVAAAGGPSSYYRAKQQRERALAPYARRIDALTARLGCDRDLVADAFAAALAAPPQFTWARDYATISGLDPQRDAATLQTVTAWKARRAP